MRKAKSGGSGTNTRTQGKTAIRSTMSPVFGAGKGRSSAKRLKSRPNTGR
jgi:hypothetical protein